MIWSFIIPRFLPWERAGLLNINYKNGSAIRASRGLDVQSVRVVLLLSYERGETRQRRSGARHVVHDDVSTVERERSGLGRGAHGALPLPRLSERVVHVRVVVHERMRLRSNALVFTLGILFENIEYLYELLWVVFF